MLKQRHHRVPARDVAVHPCKRLKGEHPQFFVFNIGKETVGFQVAHRGHRHAGAAQRSRQAAPEVDGRQHVLALRVNIPYGPAQPPFGANSFWLSGMPDVHGSEMGAVRVLVTDAVDYGHLTLVPQLLHRPHAGIEPYLVVERDHLVLRDMHLWAGVVVTPVAVRHHGVEIVVSARKLDNYQSLFVFGSRHLLNPLIGWRISLNLLCAG